ncbi:MAG: helix-turn-helix domain-containing protein [Candidatus Binataceae bacterium]
MVWRDEPERRQVCASFEHTDSISVEFFNFIKQLERCVQRLNMNTIFEGLSAMTRCRNLDAETSYRWCVNSVCGSPDGILIAASPVWRGVVRRNAIILESAMPYPIANRPPLSTVNVDELIADPARAKNLAFDSLPQMLTEIASRTATLKTLEGVLLSLVLSQPNRGHPSSTSSLLDAPELAKRFGVPESWAREQARLGKLPFIRLGHYVRFRLEEVERYLSERANQAA